MTILLRLRKLKALFEKTINYLKIYINKNYYGFSFNSYPRENNISQIH